MNENLVLWVAIRQKFSRLGDFCREAGLSHWKLSRVIHGHLQPDPAFKEAVASKLGVDSNEIFPN
jgi:hypothetical protein